MTDLSEATELTYPALQNRTDAGRPHAAPVLERVAIHGRLGLPLLVVDVEQVYRNGTDHDIEVVYTFPLPRRAALMRLAFELGGKVYNGTVQPKQQAQQRYEQAIGAGDTPVLVEREREGLFTAQLGNLKAGETAVIRLGYAQLAEFDRGAWRVTLPTVLAPQYGDPQRDGGLSVHAATGSSLLADYPLRVTLDVAGLEDPAAVTCTSHATQVRRVEEGVQLVTDPAARLDRDVVVQVVGADPADAAAGSVVAAALCAPDRAGSVVVASVGLPQPAAAGAVGTSRGSVCSVRLVLDCSGSMAGESLNWATVASRRMITLLNDHDEFAITRFGSSHEHWRAAMVPATVTHRTEALQYLLDVDADLGGTETQAALQAASALQRTDGARGQRTEGTRDQRTEARHDVIGETDRDPRGAGIREQPADSDLLLITDGEIWAVDELVRWARGAHRRIFVIGVGAAPNRAFLEALADATGGRCAVVTPGEALVQAVDRFVALMRSTRPAALEVTWPCKPTWTLQWPLRVLPGDAVTVFAGFEQPVESLRDHTIGLRVDGWHTTVPLRPDAGSDVPMRMAAAERIRCGQFADPAIAAIDYQLVTQWTSLIAVVQRDAQDKAGTLPELAQVRHMLAAGWGGVSAAKVQAAAAPAMRRGVAMMAREASTAPQGILGSVIHATFGDDVSAYSEPVSDVNFDLRFSLATPTRSRVSELSADAPPHGAEDTLEALLLRQRDLDRWLQRIERLQLSDRQGGGTGTVDLAMLRAAGLPDALLDALAVAASGGVPQGDLIAALLDALRLLQGAEVASALDRAAQWDGAWIAAAAAGTRHCREVVKQSIDRVVLVRTKS